MFCLPPVPLTDSKNYRKLRRSKYNIHGTCLPGNTSTTTKKTKTKRKSPRQAQNQSQVASRLIIVSYLPFLLKFSDGMLTVSPDDSPR